MFFLHWDSESGKKFDQKFWDPGQTWHGMSIFAVLAIFRPF